MKVSRCVVAVLVELEGVVSDCLSNGEVVRPGETLSHMQRKLRFKRVEKKSKKQTVTLNQD